MSVVAGAVDNLDGVREQRGDRVERFDGAFRAAGKIEDERGAANGGNATGENRSWRVLKSFAAHFFGYAGD